MDVDGRARILKALGDPHRLAVVDALWRGDLTSGELGARVGAPPNLLAHHLAALEDAGVIARRVSEADRRARYVTLRAGVLDGLLPGRGDHGAAAAGTVLFVCTHNSARSQFAAALWATYPRHRAASAGSHPADRVHPGAVRAAAAFGLDLSHCVPHGLDGLTPPALVVTVCDRARRDDLPFACPRLHWSVPDPVAAGDPAAFHRAFTDLAHRITRLAVPAAAPSRRLETIP